MRLLSVGLVGRRDWAVKVEVEQTFCRRVQPVCGNSSIYSAPKISLSSLDVMNCSKTSCLWSAKLDTH